jgi:thiol-disulfide isomerase/thioredoxin
MMAKTMIEPELENPASAPPAGSSAKQRRAFIAAAGLSAIGGVGFAWWRSSRSETGQPSEPMDGLWSMHWQSPQGSPIKMQSFKGRPILVNFWATWCPPCVDELPLINAFYRQNVANGWQVLGLAVDKASAVQSFLKTTQLDFPIAMAGLPGTELSRSLGNLSGALPFSVAIGSDGLVRQRKMGRLTPEDLALWVQLK